MIIFYALLWYGVGLCGFVYWWTREFDFTTGQIAIAALVGLTGPLTWFVGGIIHGETGKSTTLIKRKGD